MNGLNAMPPPPGGAPEPDGDESGLIPVPLSSLAQPDDKEQMQTPKEGDPVSMQVDATLVSINGEMGMVKVSAINGKPLDEGQEEPAESPDGASSADAEATLRASMGDEGGPPMQ